MRPSTTRGSSSRISSGVYYPIGKALGGAIRPIPGYFYSSFFAVLMMPLAAFDVTTAAWIWGAIQAAGLVLLFVLPLRGLIRLSPLGLVLYAGVFATSFPLLHNTKWGQLSVLLAACLIGAFDAYAKDRRILAGVLLACAAAVKYYPAVFLVYFLLKRDLRVCVSFALAGVAFYLVLPVAVMGPHSWARFEYALVMALSKDVWISPDVNSQFLPYVATRWVHLASGSQQPLPPMATGLLTLGSYAIFLGNLAIIWMIERRKTNDECAISLTLLFLSLPLIVETSWPHYFAYLPFCQAAILAHLTSNRRAAVPWRRMLLALPLSSIACSSVFVFTAFPHWQAYSAVGMLCVANLLLLVCVYLAVLGEVTPSVRSNVLT